MENPPAVQRNGYKKMSHNLTRFISTTVTNMGSAGER